MDYMTVSRKLNGGDYTSGPLAFAVDMRLIFRNALTFNWDVEQECHRAAKRSRRTFELLFAPVLLSAGTEFAEAQSMENSQTTLVADEGNDDMSEVEDDKADDSGASDVEDVNEVEEHEAVAAVEEGQEVKADDTHDYNVMDAADEEVSGHEEMDAEDLLSKAEAKGTYHKNEETDTKAMAELHRLVELCGGTAEMLEGWRLEHIPRGDKVWIDPTGETVYSRLQVLRQLDLDETQGLPLFKAELQAAAAAKREALQAEWEAGRADREAKREAMRAEREARKEAERAAEKARKEAEKARKEAERAAVIAQREAERIRKVEERTAKRDAKEAERALKIAEKAARQEARRAEAEEYKRKRQCLEGDALGFRAPARPDASLLAPAVWDNQLEEDKTLPAPPTPTTPAAMRNLSPSAVTQLLMVCDFVRALGTPLGLPSECAVASQLASFLMPTPVSSSSDAAVLPQALVQLHLQLVHLLLSDETSGEWWPGAIAPSKLRSDDLSPASLARAAAPRRLSSAALTEENWPLIAVAVVIRLYDWLEVDTESLVEVQPPEQMSRQRPSAGPLQHAVWAIWAAPDANVMATHAALPAEQKLALLMLLVDGASHAGFTRDAADRQHAASLQALAQAAEQAATRAIGSKAKLEHSSITDTVCAELAKLSAVPTGKKESINARQSDEAPGSARYREVAGRLAERHALTGRPVAVLTREELECAELDLLLDVDLQCTPVDSQGRRRMPKTLWQAEAIKGALLRRRDELRAARAAAEAQLARAVSSVEVERSSGATTRQLCEALVAGRDAALEGDASADGIGPLGTAKGRWMLDVMHKAYVALAVQLCDDRSPGARAAALRQCVSLSPRTPSLGVDRWGRRHWALAPGIDEPSEPEDRLVCVEPHGGAMHGTVVNGQSEHSDSDWYAIAGIDSVEALARSLDPRGWYERGLQAALWKVCDERLREAHGLREPSGWQIAEEMLPPFTPDSHPAPPLERVKGESRSDGRVLQHAESIPGAMDEEPTDKKLFGGAYAKGWRVWAKGENGHFWYRIQTYRFTNRAEALIFDRSLDAGAEIAATLGAEGDPKATSGVRKPPPPVERRADGEDCGVCAACLDKPKFGGKGTRRQACDSKRAAFTNAQAAPPGHAPQYCNSCLSAVAYNSTFCSSCHAPCGRSSRERRTAV